MVPESLRRRQRSGSWPLACLPMIYATSTPPGAAARRADAKLACGVVSTPGRVHGSNYAAAHQLSRICRINTLSGYQATPPERQLT